MGSEYPNIKLNNKLVEIDEEEQESLTDNINSNDEKDNGTPLESTNSAEKVIHVLLKSLLSDDDTQELVQGKRHFTIFLNPCFCLFAKKNGVV